MAQQTSIKNINRKTTYILISKLANGPRIKWQGKTTKRNNSFKYLGVHIDSKLNWSDHLQHIKTKSSNLIQKIGRVAGSNWGLKKDHRKILYKTVTEKMILHGSVAWAASLTARQKRALNSIHRKFLLNISRAYSTTPTAALQVIEGSLPLYLKAELEATYINITRLKTEASLDGNQFKPSDYEGKPSSAKFHPADFQVEEKISTAKTYTPQDEINIFTDGSYLNDQTGSVFCIFIKDVVQKEWMGKLKKENSVFQAELTAIKEACRWAKHQNKPTKIWTDSESSLHSIKAIKTNITIAQDIQEDLLKTNHIKLGWVKAHSANAGNELVDQLAKKATIEGTPINIPLPRNQLKKHLNAIMVKRWQEEWNAGETGRSTYTILPKVKTTQTGWEREEIMFVTGHGPFPTYLHRFQLRDSSTCGCGEEGTPFHYATSCPLTTTYHFTKPSQHLEPIWWKRITSNKTSRVKIIQLIRFLQANEDILFTQ
ncbi:uncharacterized protein LOC129956737 [Argiope bruennichi]|uniref:uncharacterized protein LOC129956737 n=1 Tax=Argiope bruennichi TaxID=94029 RepID=UPI0024952CA7|nr:uncharacterized protein LOC129956737 [Argiope bruennichi]